MIRFPSKTAASRRLQQQLEGEERIGKIRRLLYGSGRTRAGVELSCLCHALSSAYQNTSARTSILSRGAASAGLVRRHREEIAVRVSTITEEAVTLP